MRTNIEIDDRLMRAAMRSSGRRTKRATVDEACAWWFKSRHRQGSANCGERFG